MTVKEKDDPHFVRAVARGLAVIECFDADHPAMTLSEVAKRTGLTRGTAARFLHTLECLGYVRAVGRLMSLTPRTLGLGYSYLSSQPLWRLATPILNEVVMEFGEPAGLAVLDLPDIVYVVAALPQAKGHALRNGSSGAGTRLPAHKTAAGRVLLAHLPSSDLEAHLTFLNSQEEPKEVERLRETLASVALDGYAIQSEEIELGYRAAAVPVYDVSGKVVAAMNVVAFAVRWTAEDLIERAVPVLQRRAEELGGKMALR